KCIDSQSRCPEHIEVVNFAQEILQLLEVFAPGRMVRGKKVLHDIAKTFQPNTQAMKGHLGAIAERATMQVISRGPAFERQVLKDRATGAHPGRAARQ